MSKPARNQQRVRIRKGGFEKELYLDRKGKWVSWKVAAIFTSQSAADEFAHWHGITDYGLF
jgi:hypothetical protein